MRQGRLPQVHSSQRSRESARHDFRFSPLACRRPTHLKTRRIFTRLPQHHQRAFDSAQRVHLLGSARQQFGIAIQIQQQHPGIHPAQRRSQPGGKRESPARIHRYLHRSSHRQLMTGRKRHFGRSDIEPSRQCLHDKRRHNLPVPTRHQRNHQRTATAHHPLAQFNARETNRLAAAQFVNWHLASRRKLRNLGHIHSFRRDRTKPRPCSTPTRRIHPRPQPSLQRARQHPARQKRNALGQRGRVQ